MKRAQDLTITLDQSGISTSIGRVITVESTVGNTSAAPTGRMLVHINVAGQDGKYVDLEDWSADVTKPVEALQPGQSTTVSWELQAVNSGNFQVYVVLLPDKGPLVVSTATRVEVAEQETLSAGGALPVAVAVPLVLGIVAVAIRHRAHRRTA